jgi:AcrR family transcriptional regulator
MKADHRVVRMGRPQLRSDEVTRQIIHDAARAEFLASGYASTSMEKVASRAGVSTKTLYRLIATKDDLFEGMIIGQLDEFVSKIAADGEFQNDITSALERLLVDCALFTLDEEVIGLNRRVASESDRFPEIARAFYEKGIARVPVALAAWLNAQRKRGLIELNEPRIAAGMLLGMMIWEPQRAVFLRQRRPLSSSEIAKRAKICAGLFLEGCRAKASAANTMARNM